MRTTNHASGQVFHQIIIEFIAYSIVNISVTVQSIKESLSTSYSKCNFIKLNFQLRGVCFLFRILLSRRCLMCSEPLFIIKSFVDLFLYRLGRIWTVDRREFKINVVTIFLVTWSCNFFSFPIWTLDASIVQMDREISF